MPQAGPCPLGATYLFKIKKAAALAFGPKGPFGEEARLLFFK
jgi:hypothetical protein